MFRLEEKSILFNNKEYDLLFSQNELKQAAKTMGQSINKFYHSISQNEAVTVISVLERSVTFFTDLLKAFDFRMVPQFIFERDVHNKNCQQENFDSLHFEVMKGQNVLLVLSFLEQKSILPSIIDKINQVGPKSLQSAVLVCDNCSISQLNALNTYIAFIYPTKELIGYGFGRQYKLGGLPQIYQKRNNSEKDKQN